MLIGQNILINIIFHLQILICELFGPLKQLFNHQFLFNVFPLQKIMLYIKPVFLFLFKQL